MNQTHEVISAFLDDEPFDPRELADGPARKVVRPYVVGLCVA